MRAAFSGLGEAFFDAEIAKLERDVRDEAGLAVFAEWYNVKQMESMRFFDDNTLALDAVVGGERRRSTARSRIDVQLGDKLLKGAAMLNQATHRVRDRRGRRGGAETRTCTKRTHRPRKRARAYGNAASPDQQKKPTKKQKANRAEFAIAAFPAGGVIIKSGSCDDVGRVAVFGDSNCLDASHPERCLIRRSV